MKIVLIKYGGFPSQGDTELFEITTGLEKLGNMVYVVIPRRSNEPLFEEKGNLKIIREYKIRSMHPSINLFFFHINSSFVVRRLHPDVVLATNSLGVSSVAIGARKQSHANWIYYVTTGAIREGFLSKVLNVVCELESVFFNKIVITEAHQKRLFRNTNPNKIHLVPYGVNLTEFQPGLCLNKMNPHEQANEVWFVYQGSMAKIRSIEILVDAFKRAYALAPLSRLLLVGPMQQYVLDAIKNSGCESVIKVAGSIPYQSMPNILGCCDAGLSWVPNIDALEYNPPFKAMEFLACGLPVLATNTYGNKMFVTDGCNGIIAESEAQSFGKAMALLSNNKNLRNHLSANARSSMEEYGWASIIKSKLMPLFKQEFNKQKIR